MSKWVDIVWSLSLGKLTKYSWVATDVLNINPSRLQSNYVKGDKLASTKAKTVRRRCYKKYDPISKRDMWYLETRKETIKNYVQLFTFDKNKNSILKNGTDTKHFYSKNYSNSKWIEKTVNQRQRTGVSGPLIDLIK